MVSGVKLFGYTQNLLSSPLSTDMSYLQGLLLHLVG